MEIHELKIVGYPGRLGEKQTPARRPPVYVDESGIPVTFSPEGKIERGSKPIPEDVWSTTGTRIEPGFAADPEADLILIIGPREIRIARHLRKLPNSSSNLDRVVDFFLIWIESNSPRSDSLRSIRIGDLAAWSCTSSLADALCARIATVARREVGGYALSGDFQGLRSASFWLSRAAVSDEDMELAVAGLRKSGFKNWEDIIKKQED